MAQIVRRLTALKVARLVEAGIYADGDGLYLQVSGQKAKSWIYRYMFRGKSREMGLGSVRAVTLLEARRKAAECWRLRSDGVDPIEAKKSEQARAALKAAKSLTFKEAAAAYIKTHSVGWRNAKHAAQWKSTLATHAEPVLGGVAVQAIDTALVLKVLQPIWLDIPETAGRLRGRIGAVLDWATAQGFRIGENPARWQGHLANLLPAQSKVHAVKHHAALPFDQLFDFITALRKYEGVAARALEFTLLTAARTTETIGVTWDEFDLGNKVWTIPAKRMKGGRDHRVPLSEPVMEITKEMKKFGDEAGGFVFRGGRKGKPLSNMAMMEVLRRMDRGDLTVHGFRSTFRDWASECTDFPGEVVEMALAHAVSNKVEAAYRRGDLFEKRRSLMADWARYAATSKSVLNTVVSLRRQPSLGD
jgi:integrase